MRCKLIFLAFIFVIVLQVADAAVLSGYVRDDKGEGLPGAPVVIQGTKLGDLTRADGSYSIIGISEGSYTATASLIGYEKQSQKISIKKDSRQRTDFSLKQTVIQLPGQTVEADRPVLPRVGLPGVELTPRETSPTPRGGYGYSVDYDYFSGLLKKGKNEAFGNAGVTPVANKIEKVKLQKPCKSNEECAAGLWCFGGLCTATDLCQESDGSGMTGNQELDARHNDPFTKAARIGLNGEEQEDKCFCEYPQGQYRENCEQVGLEFTHVAEYSCNKEKPVEYVACENGCKNGACQFLPSCNIPTTQERVGKPTTGLAKTGEDQCIPPFDYLLLLRGETYYVESTYYGTWLVYDQEGKGRFFYLPSDNTLYDLKRNPVGKPQWEKDYLDLKGKIVDGSGKEIGYMFANVDKKTPSGFHPFILFENARSPPRIVYSVESENLVHLINLKPVSADYSFETSEIIPLKSLSFYFEGKQLPLDPVFNDYSHGRITLGRNENEREVFNVPIKPEGGVYLLEAQLNYKEDVFTQRVNIQTQGIIKNIGSFNVNLHGSAQNLWKTHQKWVTLFVETTDQEMAMFFPKAKYPYREIDIVNPDDYKKINIKYPDDIQDAPIEFCQAYAAEKDIKEGPTIVSTCFTLLSQKRLGELALKGVAIHESAHLIYTAYFKGSFGSIYQEYISFKLPQDNITPSFVQEKSKSKVDENSPLRILQERSYLTAKGEANLGGHPYDNEDELHASAYTIYRLHGDELAQVIRALIDEQEYATLHPYFRGLIQNIPASQREEMYNLLIDIWVKLRDGEFKGKVFTSSGIDPFTNYK